MAETTFDWEGDTRPFRDAHGRTPAHFSLRQISGNDFDLIEPFTFRTREGETFIVNSALMGCTDIASVPSFLGWFARRAGDHTPAALLHDQLISEHPEQLPQNQQMPPAAADLIFRGAMRDCGVPVVKAWIMWSAVSLRTRWHGGLVSGAAIVVWFLAAGAGSVALIEGFLNNRPGLGLLAAVAPIPFSVLWGAQFRAGLVAGYAFWLAVFGSLPAFIAYHVYWLIEFAVRLLRLLHPANRVPEADLAMPPAFQNR